MVFLKRTWEKNFASSSFFIWISECEFIMTSTVTRRKKLSELATNTKKDFSVTSSVKFCTEENDTKGNFKLFLHLYKFYSLPSQKIKYEKIPLGMNFALKHTGGWTINVSLSFVVRKVPFYSFTLRVHYRHNKIWWWNKKDCDAFLLLIFFSYSFSLCQCHIFYDKKYLPTFLFMPMQCLLLCCSYTYIIGKSNNNNITIRQINIWWFFNLTLFILWFAFEALLMHSWIRHSIPFLCTYIHVLIYFWCENILQIEGKWMKMHGTKEWK